MSKVNLLASKVSGIPQEQHLGPAVERQKKLVTVTLPENDVFNVV